MRPAIQLRTQSSLTRPLGLAALCFLIGLGLVVWFGNIALRTLTEPDEARYAEIAREMLATGDWVTPHLNGIAYFEKPPLQYWATAVAYSVFGAQPWVARLWTTGFGLLGLVLTYATAKKLWGVRTAEHAALLLASFPLYFIVTHLNLLDGALAFFLNAAVCAFVVAKQPDTPLLARRRLLYLCWFALALGFLQKGLVALVLPFLALTTYSLLYRDSRLWREMQLRAGLAILAAVTLPWTTLVASRNPGFLEFFFVHEQFTRFLTTVHDRYQPWWYFIAVLIAGVSPWLVVAVRTTIHAVRRRATLTTSPQAERLLLIWAIVQLTFFSLSDSKLAPYVLPMTVPMALLMARWLDLYGTMRTLNSVAVTITVLLLLLIASPWLLPHLVVPGLKLTTYLQVAEWAQYGGFAGLACMALYVLVARGGDLRSPVTALAASVSLALAIFMCGANALDHSRGQANLAAVIAPHLAADAPLFCVGTYWQALPFDLKRTCIVVEYRGEFELQFDPNQRNHLAGVREFVERWKHEPGAVALVTAELWPQIANSGIEARTVMHDDNVVVLVAPDPCSARNTRSRSKRETSDSPLLSQLSR